MRIYHSGLSLAVVQKYHQLKPKRKLNALLTYGISHKDSYDLQNSYRNLLRSLILDSGTYSLNRSERGKDKITFEGYEKYLKSHKRKFDFYFNFDADWTDSGSENNKDFQHQLEYDGFKPVPVIHDIYGDEVEYYVGQGYNRIAIGSSELVDKNAIGWIVERLYRKGIKVHLFGTTNEAFLIDIPVYSCDSSTWRQVAARDYIMFHNPVKGTTDNIRLETVVPTQGQKWKMFKSYKYCKQLEAYLWDELQLQYSDLLGYDGPVNRQIVNVHFLAELQRRITENHKLQGWQY